MVFDSVSPDMTDKLQESTVWARQKSAPTSLIHAILCISLINIGTTVFLIPQKAKIFKLKTLEIIF